MHAVHDVPWNSDSSEHSVARAEDLATKLKTVEVYRDDLVFCRSWAWSLVDPDQAVLMPTRWLEQWPQRSGLYVLRSSFGLDCFAWVHTHHAGMASNVVCATCNKYQGNTTRGIQG